jgi:predicted nucleic acid-binding protein
LSVVVDASATLSFHFADERTPRIEALSAHLEVHGAVAPSLWPIETANGLLVAERRGRLLAGAAQVQLQLAFRIPIEVTPAPAGETLLTVLALAQHHRLTVYDACYLELALRRRLPLATNDAELASAAQAAGVRLWEPRD